MVVFYLFLLSLRHVANSIRALHNRFVNALLVRKREAVKPLAGKLIRAFLSASQREKSHAVKKRFLSVAAELANLNCEKHMPKLLEEFERLWDEDKENDLYTAGILIQKCAAYAGEGFAMHAGLFLSRAFVARCNEDRTTSEIWDEVWDNNISGETTALQHHFKAIVAVISQELQVWLSACLFVCFLKDLQSVPLLDIATL